MSINPALLDALLDRYGGVLRKGRHRNLVMRAAIDAAMGKENT